MTLGAAALVVPQPTEVFIASLRCTVATKHCRTPRRPRTRETRRRFVVHSASGFHQPLSSAQDDRGKVNDSSTTAQVDEFQRRRQLQPDKSGVSYGRLGYNQLTKRLGEKQVYHVRDGSTRAE
jgi:hypothetical protein